MAAGTRHGRAVKVDPRVPQIPSRVSDGRWESESLRDEPGSGQFITLQFPEPQLAGRAVDRLSEGQGGRCAAGLPNHEVTGAI